MLPELASNRRTAKAWRKECGVIGLPILHRSLTCRQVRSIVRGEIGWPGLPPGNSQSPGWVHLQYSRSHQPEVEAGVHRCEISLQKRIAVEWHDREVLSKMGQSLVAARVGGVMTTWLPAPKCLEANISVVPESGKADTRPTCVACGARASRRTSGAKRGDAGAACRGGVGNGSGPAAGGGGCPGCERAPASRRGSAGQRPPCTAA